MAQNKQLKVGVYQNVPLTFVEEDGSVKGFFIDILEHIAAEEDWQVTYIPNPWAQNLHDLGAGNIDLLGVIAYSLERNQRFDYMYESVLTEWGQIYVREDSAIESILDLRGKKIAVLSDDMHYLNLRRLLDQFGIVSRFIEAFEYDAVLELVDIGKCEAGLVSQFYGAQYERDYDIQKSAIILSPQKLYWAAPKYRHQDVLFTLDNHLARLKEDEESIYYRSLNKWFGVGSESWIGKWFKEIIIGAAALLAAAFGVIVAFRAQVQTKTEEIRAQNVKLLDEIEQREQAEKERAAMENKLRRAQKMEALGTLAGGVAHDLNNILSGLVSYPELLLLDLPPDSRLRNPILTIKKSGERAATIVQDLLTLARRGVAVTEVVNLNAIIQEYLASPEHKKLGDDNPNITIHHDLTPKLLNIAGSEAHLSKTVMNLVSNAAEAMPNGGEIFIRTNNQYVDVPVRGYDEVEEGDYVVLSVSDTGVGMSAEDLDRIFEPFYTKKVMGRSGSGLGMAVVWGTVKDHAGYIDIHSREDQGTSVTVFFPVVRDVLPEVKEAPLLQEIKGDGETILVVDDIEDQREIARHMLKRLGYRVVTKESGEAAEAYLKENSVDMIILDMIMAPGIDGLETYRRVLKLHPGQKAIIASGFSETHRVREAQRLGAGEYIKKPYTVEKIGRAIREALSQS